MRSILIACVLLLAISGHTEQQMIQDLRIQRGTRVWGFSLRRESDGPFVLLLTVPEPRDEKWRYSDLNLEVFDQRDRKIEVTPLRKPEEGFVSVISGPGGGKTSFAAYTLGTGVPARARLRAKTDDIEVMFDATKVAGAASSRRYDALTVTAQPITMVPDGNYLLTVELQGKQQRLNLKVQDGRAKCVKASDASLANVEGRFQKAEAQFTAAPNAFLARFRGGLGSQLWMARADGSFAVREIPDRGEQQSAVPVKGDSFEVPRAK